MPIILVAGMALAAATANAGDRSGRPDFATLDADGDGQLSWEEMSQMQGPRGAPSEEMFERLDADDDGYVSRDEMRAMRGKRRSDS